MGLFDSIFGGSKSSTAPAKLDAQQAPFLRGLYERAYGASLGQGAGGYYPGGQAGGALRYGVGGKYSRPAAGGRAGIQPAPGQPGSSYGNDPLQGLGQQLTGAGMGFLGSLGQGAMGQGPFQGALAGYAQAGNPFALQQVQQYGNELGRLFTNSINPAITSTFGQSGTLGGDRQALALGQAAEGLGSQFRGGALDILGNSAALGVDAARAGAYGQLGFGQAGLQGLGDVFGAGNMGVFGSLPGLAGLLGSPTVLGGGGSTRQTGGILGALTGGFTNSAGTMGIGF